VANGAPARSTTSTRASAGKLALPLLVPCLLLRKGQVCLPGPTGPVRVKTRTGTPLDPFDVIDRLKTNYERLYLVDLDGIERGAPQLEYIQELSRDIDLWVDAGVPTADSAIDILVAGAQRAVLSSSYLRAPVEIRRAWKLSTDWAFEVETVEGVVQNATDAWTATDVAVQVEAARLTGITDIVLSPRQADPNWDLVRTIAAGGPTWVDGTFEAAAQGRLAETGAAGGIFHLDRVLADLVVPPDGSPEEAESVSPRDDED
jgi:phosphoribosylformimino-5-aminoimidazole carboxamide ribonucleotide (ProFAR) isomerase